MEVFYTILSFSVAFVSIVAIKIALDAMHKGLTYTSMTAVVWALGFMGLARTLHAIREMLMWEEMFGEIPEMIEYVMYIVAYMVFIFLAWKTSRVDDPRSRIEEKFLAHK